MTLTKIKKNKGFKRKNDLNQNGYKIRVSNIKMTLTKMDTK